MHYYTHNIGEFASLTRMMSLDEIGLTMILIDEYVRTEKPIAYETFAMYVESLADGERVATDSLTTRYEKRVLRRVFVETADGWVCPSLDEQLRKYEARAEINRANAKRPRKKTDETKQSQGFEERERSDSDSQANRKPVASESLTTNNQEPKTNNQEEKSATHSTRKRVERPADVDPQVWADWLKARKAPLTQTAWEGVVREAEKAGITVEEAVRCCAESGWRGFRAEWYQNRTATASRKPAARSSELDFDSIDYSEGINPDGSF